MSKFSKSLDSGQNFWKIFILVGILEKSQLQSKFSKNPYFSRNFRKNSFLVKMLEKFQF